jgi:hypothetical protein
MNTLLPRIDKLEKKVEEHDEKIGEHEQLLIGIPDCPGIVARVKTLETSISNIEKSLVSINVYMKLLAFIGSAIGLSVIAFLWAILTHSVEIVR